jgi:hypothetical protein
MKASYLRHKCRLERFVHQRFYRKGTMVMFPLFLFWRDKPDRPRLAEALREVRSDPKQLQEFKSLACF